MSAYIVLLMNPYGAQYSVPYTHIRYLYYYISTFMRHYGIDIQDDICLLSVLRTAVTDLMVLSTPHNTTMMRSIRTRNEART